MSENPKALRFRIFLLIEQNRFRFGDYLIVLIVDDAIRVCEGCTFLDGKCTRDQHARL